MLRRGSVALAMLLAFGCGSCEPEGSGRVPFKTDDDGPSKREAVDEPEPRGKRFEPRDGQGLAEGTRRVAIEGALLEVSEGALRALIAADFDDDGDRDALVLRTEDQGSADIAFARREGSSFEALQTLAPMAQPAEGCSIRKAALRIVSAHLATGSIRRDCEHGPERAVALLSLEATPRVQERITLLPEKDRAPGKVSVTLRTADEDDDGYEDVVLGVKIRPSVGDEVELELTWLDRPGGLAREREEPERTIAELASRARGRLDENPQEALAFAQRAQAVHGVLCRGGEGPRLRFGDSDGLACKRSRGAAEAAAVSAAALARDGKLFEALESASRLRDGRFEVGEQLFSLVDRAWAEAPRPDGLKWRKVATHRAPQSPKVRLPAVGFVAPDRLLLRGDAPRVVDLSSGETHPAADDGSILLRDPAGDYAVVEVRRSCEGFVLAVVEADRVVAGVVAGRPVAEPLLEPRGPPAGSHCPGRIGDQLASQDGGWRVLGWAPQGVVAVRADAMRVVPLTAEGQPAGAPTELGAGTKPPAPLPQGFATPDGQAYVLATRYGVFLRRLSPADETVLLRPDGWNDVDGDVGDVAIAEDESRVAVMRGDEVWVLEGFETP